MEIKKKYYEKYLHDIAIEQIAEEYLQKGYDISKEEHLGEYQPDLVAKKGDETIVIEVKSGKMTPDKKEAIKQLGNYVRRHNNFRFLVAIATPPREKKLEISDIEDLLTHEMIENLPDQLKQLSSHSRIEELSDIDIDEIAINGKSIFVKGDGVVSVDIQYGSDSDQNSDEGHKTYDSFPFDFELTLQYNDKNKLEIKEVNKLEVDISYS
jgi:Holliday junction resolvase